MTKLQIGVVGASGRMGTRLCRLLADSNTAELSAVLRHLRPPPERLVGTALSTSDVDALVQHCQVVIDFSAPAGAERVAPACAKHQTPYLIASTALSPAAEQSVQAASQSVPVLWSANLSLGIYVLGQLLEQALRALPSFTLELLEAHHCHKLDAPSGTAKSLFAAAKRARPELTMARGAFGDRVERHEAEVGVHAVRGGDVAGDHHAWLFGEGERIELTHRSHDGLLFARGAVSAARWLVSQPAGLYGMGDLIGRPADLATSTPAAAAGHERP